MTTPEKISVAELVSVTYTTALSKTIDSPSNMKKHKVYLFSGTEDTIVVPGTYAAIAELTIKILAFPGRMSEKLVCCVCVCFFLLAIFTGVMKKVEEYYSHFTEGIETEFSIPSQHSMVNCFS